MKTPCNVIRDLLPLYHDGVCSPESRQLVEEHLEECADCRGELERMDTPLPTAHPQVNERTVAAAASSAWRRGRRRAFSKGFVLAAVLVAVVCGLVALWAWGNRSPRTVTGRIVETQLDNTTGDVTYVVYTTRGEQIGLLMEEDTWIRSYFDAYTDQAFRDGEIADALHIYAELGGSKETILNQDGEKIPAYPAQLVEIDAYQMPDLMTLNDGTQVEVWQGHRGVLYALHDGPELLDVHTPYPPDIALDGVQGLEELSQEAQDNIVAYYEKQCLLYDELEELEAVYQSYLEAGSPASFSTCLILQDTYLSASSPRVIYFTTSLQAPSKYLEVGTAFYRDTGERVDMEDLFTCTSEELEQALLDEAEITDPTLRQEMEEAFDLDRLILYPDLLKVGFEAGSLPSQDATYFLSFDYDDTILERMHAWAVPYSQ
ncbi:zf-HC2 domain-containing protein [Pseudoflavonifractor capillosus]|uniref:zf-HC2 domain-containing protein n=1 Tax=Pseudoflavonifractor capillosus TaxID=106588 RepID=UPI00195B66D6|nr:zf-HC2 domain-containing protein [Pseudoflavonifractor capillosus]MBM6896739.1 zf-HC2 domain-containing protein [Pseudoflavonifractor capillosus]